MSINPMQREIKKIKSELFEISKGIHQILELLKKDEKFSVLIKESDNTSFSDMKHLMDSMEEEG
jgi:hypothetical protein